VIDTELPKALDDLWRVGSGLGIGNLGRAEMCSLVGFGGIGSGGICAMDAIQSILCTRVSLRLISGRKK
jgi:hypothetical protein